MLALNCVQIIWARLPKIRLLTTVFSYVFVKIGIDIPFLIYFELNTILTACKILTVMYERYE